MNMHMGNWPPKSPVVGEIWYDTMRSTTKCYTGNNVWINMADPWPDPKADITVVVLSSEPDDTHLVQVGYLVKEWLTETFEDVTITDYYKAVLTGEQLTETILRWR